MPSWTSRGRPLHERSAFELLQWIVLLPIVGAVMIVFGVTTAVRQWRELMLLEWLFQVVWLLVVGTVLAGGPPNVAIGELRRRKRKNGNWKPTAA